MKRYISAILFSALFAGCITDGFETPGALDTDDLKATLTLRVTGGGQSDNPTRALTAADENAIEEIDILVFRKTAAGDSDAGATFFYRAQTVRILDSDATDTSKKNFQVTLQKSADYQRLVVLANSRTPEIEAAIAGFDQNTTYADAMATLVMVRSTAWNSATGSYDPLPMWGQNDFKVFTDAASAADEIELIRSVARVDVVVDAAAQAGFSLTGVYLYNPSTKGLLAPAAANWNAAGGKVTAASLPAAGRAAASNFAYTSMTTAGKALNGVIYTFEAPKSAGNTSAADPFLLVTGSWNGEPVSWYRIDFHDGSAFVPLLRNFHYMVSIDEVSGRGYPTAAEAIAAGLTGLTATTQVWDAGGMGSVVWDQGSMLSVTANEWTVDRSGHTVTAVKAATNYSGGWKASAVMTDDAASNWFMLTTASGAGNKAAHSVGMTIQPNTYGAARKAVVTVTAGRLKQTITVTQNYNLGLSLNVGDVEIVFTGAAPAAFSLPVEWNPASQNVSLELIHAGTPAAAAYDQLTGYTAGLAFSGGNAIPASISDADGNSTNGGFRQLSLLPSAVTLGNFVERRSILKLTAGDGEGNFETKTVLLRQLNYIVTVTGGLTGYHLGTTYTFTVRANAQWKVTVSGDASQITVPVTQGDPNTAGTAFSFTTGNTDGAVPVLTFSLPEHGYSAAPVNIKLERLEPNCFIVNPAPGSNTVTIPVRKAFRLWKNDADLNGTKGGDPSAMTSGNYTTELLWQDEQSVVSSVGQPDVMNENGVFTVTVNNAGIEGNAYVVLKENGIIRWGWHLWVVKDFDPLATANRNSLENHILMDRNLGATTNFAPEYVDDVRSHGLFFQHGRPSPFPNSGKTVVNSVKSSKTLYNISNATLAPDTPEGFRFEYPSATPNLHNALMNPLTYYKTSGNIENGWYVEVHTTANSRTDLWNVSGRKTDYDPCPEGWKVPYGTILNYIEYDGNDMILGKGIHLTNIAGEYVGFFPATGYRYYYNDNVVSVGAATWISMATSRALMRLYTTLTISVATSPGYGTVARCVKIQ